MRKDKDDLIGRLALFGNINVAALADSSTYYISKRIIVVVKRRFDHSISRIFRIHDGQTFRHTSGYLYRAQTGSNWGGRLPVTLPHNSLYIVEPMNIKVSDIAKTLLIDGHIDWFVYNGAEFVAQDVELARLTTFEELIYQVRHQEIEQ